MEPLVLSIIKGNTKILEKGVRLSCDSIQKGNLCKCYEETFDWDGDMTESCVHCDSDTY